jgi:hypothetical protein
MSIYKSKKSKFYYIAGSIPILFLLCITAYDFLEKNPVLNAKEYISRLCIALLLFGFMFIFNKITYKIDKDKLIIKSIIFKKEMEIQHFHSIYRNKKRFVTIEKAALATNGIIIRYSKYDEIYISPEKENEFIAELKAINPSISVDL